MSIIHLLKLDNYGYYPAVILILGIMKVGCSVASEEEFLDLAYGDSRYVTIATGNHQSLLNAPAIASVITREDIEASGAMSLDDILRSVPGLHVTYSPSAYNSIYIFRGLATQVNSQVLILLNGVPITQAYLGDQGRSFTGFPLHAVERIEIIRGPGSALYGADAFSGVINIISQSAENTERKIGVRSGSFDRRGVTFSSPFHIGEINGGLSFFYEKVGPTEQIVEADRQALSDTVFLTSASETPGEINNGISTIDLSFDLEYENWNIQSNYYNRYDAGVGVGYFGILDPSGKIDSERFALQLSKDLLSANPSSSLKLKIAYQQFDESSKSKLLPEGALLDFGDSQSNMPLPRGIIVEPSYRERHYFYNLIYSYSGWLKHRITAGVGGHSSEIFDSKEKRNYDTEFNILDSMIMFTGIDAFIDDHRRRNQNLYIQDEWMFARDWTLTSGVRYDDYSDFGSTINPRLALVWQYNYDVSMKFLYGKAYRAPSFFELFVTNNPYIKGNSKLKPEEIDAFEIGVSCERLIFYQVSFNAFYFETDNLTQESGLVGSAITIDNIDSSRGYGFEAEALHRFRESVVVEGNYAYQKVINNDLDDLGSSAPQHQVFLRANWTIIPSLGLGLGLEHLWVSDREIAFNRPSVTLLTQNIPDFDEEVDGYSSTDITVTFEPHGKLSSKFVVRNVFDNKRVEPTDFTQFLPEHLPLAGRAAVLSLSMDF